ncbi:hypothetical protein A8B78_14305 [Jannaschia sp. EhC01]|nr:hypothetical protein A8B78_14305 [Jannaschia sp. EhC01]
MKINAVPKYDASVNETGCCAKFNPVGWDDRILHFRDKPFVRATTRSAMHVPLNMGRVFGRVLGRIEDANAMKDEEVLVLSRELGPWEAEHYFAVTKDVAGEEMTTLSGDFLTRVFEGSYAKAADWGHEMEVAARAHGKTPGRVFMYYTTCPRCANVYGENYVVGMVEI